MSATFDRRTSAADVELAGEGPSRAKQDKPFVQRLTVQDLGPQHAFDVLVTAELPDGLRLIRASATGATCRGQRLVRCRFDELAPSASDTIRLRVDARKAGTVRTRGSVSSLSSDTNDANDSIRLRTVVRN